MDESFKLIPFLPVQNYLKILPPHLPIYYFVQIPSEQQSVIVINHPKAQLKTATIHISEPETEKQNENSIEIPMILKREINIISIFIKESTKKTLKHLIFLKKFQ